MIENKFTSHKKCTMKIVQYYVLPAFYEGNTAYRKKSDLAFFICKAVSLDKFDRNNTPFPAFKILSFQEYK